MKKKILAAVITIIIVIICLILFPNILKGENETLSGEQTDEIILYDDNFGFMLRIPKTWEGRYLCNPFEPSDNLVFELYNKYNYELYEEAIGGGGGSLFTILADPLEAVDSIEEWRIIGKNDNYLFVYIEPTDVQFMLGNKEAEQDYSDMFADVQGIIENFLSDNDITPVTDFCSDGYVDKRQH